MDKKIKMKIKFLPFLISVTLVSQSCSSMPKSYQEAEVAIQNKDVLKASALLENADAEKKENRQIEEKLATVNLQAIALLNASINNLSEYDLDKLVSLLENAQHKLQKTVALNKKFHQELKSDGPSMMESLNLKLDKNYQTKETLLSKEIGKEEEQLKRITAQLIIAKDKQSQVEKATDKLLAQSEKKAPAAWEGFAAYLPYMSTMPSVKSKGDTIQERAVIHHYSLGMKELARQKVKEASGHFENALKTNPDHLNPQSGLHLASAVDAEKNKKFRDAYLFCKKAEEVTPESSEVLSYKKRMAKSLVSDEFKTMNQLAKKAALTQNVLAFQSLSLLETLAPELDPLLGEKLAEKIPHEKNELRQLIAKKLIDQAQILEKKDAIAYSGLILNHYQMAYLLAPALTQKHIAKAQTALSITNKKDQLRIFLYESALPKERDLRDAQITISENLIKELEALKSQSLSNLVIHTAEALPKDKSKAAKAELKDQEFLSDKVIPYSFAEVVIKHQMEDLKFEESGRDQPRQKSSQYISGQRWVHNPDYDQAYSAWQSAENNYRYQAQQREQALRSCDQMANAFAQGICRGAIQGISSYSRDQARAVLDNTPKEVSQNIISNYRYTTYTIKVKGRAVASVNIYDKRSGTALPALKFEVEVDKEGIINEEVEATDQNGITAGQFNVPDLINEIDLAKKELAAKIATNIKETMTTHYYQRFCQQANELSKKKKTKEATEAQILCHTIAKKLGRELDPTPLEKMLAESIGLSTEVAKQYAWQEVKVEDSTAEENQRKPASAEGSPQASWPSGEIELSEKLMKEIQNHVNNK